MWAALNPHDGTLPPAAEHALLRLVSVDLKPTLKALGQIDAPASIKSLVAEALTEQSAGMTTLARAMHAKDPATAARLSRRAAKELRSAVHTMRRAGLPGVGGA